MRCGSERTRPNQSVGFSSFGTATVPLTVPAAVRISTSTWRDSDSMTRACAPARPLRRRSRCRAYCCAMSHILRVAVNGQADTVKRIIEEVSTSLAPDVLIWDNPRNYPTNVGLPAEHPVVMWGPCEGDVDFEVLN